MKKKLKNKNEGILFWVTGLSGSGKSTIAKNIFYKIKKIYGPTLLIHGDNLRNIFKLNGYSLNERLMIGKMYIDLINLIIKQKINVIFTVNGLFHSLRNINKKKFKNYDYVLLGDIHKYQYLDENNKNNIELLEHNVYTSGEVNGVESIISIQKISNLINSNVFNKECNNEVLDPISKINLSVL